MALKVNKKDSSKKGSQEGKKYDEEITEIYDIKVLRAKQFDNAIAFDVRINGVSIYGCWYRTYEDRNKPGEEVGFVSFPSRKGNDGKWYSHAFIKIEKDAMEVLEKQLEEALK